MVNGIGNDAGRHEKYHTARIREVVAVKIDTESAIFLAEPDAGVQGLLTQPLDDRLYARACRDEARPIATP